MITTVFDGKRWVKLEGTLIDINESMRERHETSYKDGLKHGIKISWRGRKTEYNIVDKIHYLYGEEVVKEEYRKHEIIERLSGMANE